MRVRQVVNRPDLSGILSHSLARNDMKLASLTTSVGMCAPLCIWAGASLYGANASFNFENSAPVRRTIETVWRGDRLAPPAAADAADLAFVSVEVAGRFDSATIVRVKNGRLL